MKIFFDTEFTGLIVDPKLISIGLVSLDGEKEFYVELSDTWQEPDLDEFPRLAILPLLEGGRSQMTYQQLAQALRNWIESFSEPVQLVTDSLSWDWPWIQEIFYDCPPWPANLDQIPIQIRQSEEFNLATEMAFSTGLRRHHALDDARANQIAWIQTLQD